jgi:hypothetical protein
MSDWVSCWGSAGGFGNLHSANFRRSDALDHASADFDCEGSWNKHAAGSGSCYSVKRHSDGIECSSLHPERNLPVQPDSLLPQWKHGRRQLGYRNSNSRNLVRHQLVHSDCRNSGRLIDCVLGDQLGEIMRKWLSCFEWMEKIEWELGMEADRV